MELLVGAALLLAIWIAAPRLGVINRTHAKGLAAIQTLCAIAGIILLIVWYFVDRPDAERMKFDQAVTTAPLAGRRVLVVTELSIANVGGHPAELHDQPYYMLIQRVSSLAPPPPDAKPPPPPPKPGRMEDARNWPLEDLLAYRIGAKDRGPFKRTAEGLSADISPGETENFYFRATLACEPGLHVSVSSRVEKQRSLWQRLTRQTPLVWIKQSFLDLTALCAPDAKEKTP